MKNTRRLIRSYSRFIFVLFVLLCAFVFAMFQGGYVSWTIFYAILPFVIYSISLFFYPLSLLTVERVIRTPRVQNGEKLTVIITVKRRFRFPLLYTVVSEKLRDAGQLLPEEDKLTKIFLFGFRGEIEWEYEIEQMPRGEHVLEGVEVEVTDFFGWIRKTRFIPIKNTILVYPKMTELLYMSIDTENDRGAIISPYNIVKDTTMATGIRDYQSGDRVSWIHWKSFARTQVLMTKEFEDRKSQELTLILDGRPSEMFEGQVEFAASILKEATNHKARIGFLATGPEHVAFPVIESEEQFRRVLIHLAKIKPTDDILTRMPIDFRGVSQQGGSTILITGSPDWPFIESVMANMINTKSIICFVIVEKMTSVSSILLRDIQLAKSKGIAVHTVTKSQFSTAFKGVTRS